MFFLSLWGVKSITRRPERRQHNHERGFDSASQATPRTAEWCQPISFRAANISHCHCLTYATTLHCNKMHIWSGWCHPGTKSALKRSHIGQKDSESWLYRLVEVGGDDDFNLLIWSWRNLLDVQLWAHENCHQHLTTNVSNYPLYIAVTLANSLMKKSVQLQFCNPQNTFALVQTQLWDIELSKTSQSNNNEKSLGSEWSCWHKASDWYTAHECVTNRNRRIIPSTASVCNWLLWRSGEEV